MATIPLPATDYLRERFEYDPSRGVLLWRVRSRSCFSTDRAWNTWNSRFAGREAGCLSDNRRQLCLDWRIYKVHRIIWKLVYGTDPGPEIDHRNISGSDNRLSNLRKATRSQNCCNRKPGKNRTGFLGVMPQCGK